MRSRYIRVKIRLICFILFLLPATLSARAVGASTAQAAGLAEARSCLVAHLESYLGARNDARAKELAIKNEEFGTSIHSLPRHFRQAIVEGFTEAERLKDRQLQIWRWLGVKIETVPKDLKLTFPRLEDLIVRYNRLMRSTARAAGSTLVPGKAYRESATGKLFFQDYLKEPPRDAYEVTYKVMADADLIEMVRSGYFPLAPSRSHHDLAHLTGFLEFPSYREALIEYFKKLDVAAASNKDGRLYPRYAYALEGLDLVPRSNREALRQVLSEPFQSVGNDGSVEIGSLQKHLSRLEGKSLEAHANRLLDGSYRLVNRYGGASRDIGLSYQDFHLVGTIDNLRARVKDSLAAEGHPDLIENTARLEIALWESTRLTPEVVLHELANPGRLSRESPAHRFFCSAGIFNSVPANTHFPVGFNSFTLFQSLCLE